MVLTLFFFSVITTSFLNIFTAVSWTPSSTYTPDDITDSIEDGPCSLIPTSDCHLKTTSDGQVHNVWLTTPVSCFVPLLSPVFCQVFLNTYLPPYIGPDSRYHPDATEPLVKDGRALPWQSHDIPITPTQAVEQAGKFFGREHEILGWFIGFLGVLLIVLKCGFICRKRTSSLYALVLVSRDGNYMLIHRA